jgi:hypothetical protein
LAILDAATDAPCSTAEVEVARNVQTRRLDTRIVQHTGTRNRIPSEACARAMTELLQWCADAQGQLHLDKRFELIQRRERDGLALTQLRADLDPLSMVLRRTIGDETYEALVTAGDGDQPGEEDPGMIRR